MGLLSSIGSAVSKALKKTSSASKSNSISKSNGSSGSSKTIDDYKRDYAAAKASGNADAMKAANDGANAIRTASGQAAQYANGDIASVRKNSSNGDWIGGSNSGGSSSSYVPGSGIHKSSGQDYINSMADAQKKAQIEALNRQYDAYRNKVEGQISELPSDYQTARNQSELERYKAEKALKEQMANSGTLYSGQGRQDNLQLNNAASGRLNTINTEEQNAVNRLKQSLNEAMQARDSGIASARANVDASTQQALLNDMYRREENERSDYWNKLNYELSKAGVTGKLGDGTATLQKQYQDYQIKNSDRDYELKLRELEDQLLTNKITRQKYTEQVAELKRKKQSGNTGVDIDNYVRGGGEGTPIKEPEIPLSSGDGQNTYLAPVPKIAAMNQLYIMPDGSSANRAQINIIKKYGFNPFTLVGTEKVDKATILKAFLEMKMAL